MCVDKVFIHVTLFLETFPTLKNSCFHPWRVFHIYDHKSEIVINVNIKN